ncbi:MAG: cadmium-translocating P-type ATPase, partial [Candidatus Aenigmarchaeota archaeon]|nr:cadmium-translocating P-type ATPase [Candidatus Aenigmarchaeota archaeon]
LIRSGTVNIGQPIAVRVTKTEEDSTYRKIVDMVKEAESEKSPMVRMAEKYSMFFTIATFAVSAFAYVYSGYDLTRVLAVLAVATPCPLIIATPIALLGGMNAAAKKNVIVKKLAALEMLSRVQAIVFDKTGTITLGRPRVSGITLQGMQNEDEAFSVAEAIERNSLHPLAKAIVSEARKRNVDIIHAADVRETLGMGISGVVNGKEYMLTKTDGESMSIALSSGTVTQATFRFDDEIKPQSQETLKRLEESGISLHIFTGDKKGAAEKIVAQLGTRVSVRAECTPQDKQEGIGALRREGKVVAMVGDGINDAPALALADVGLAFSNEEQTASSEAADIVFLGGDFSMVINVWEVSKKTVTIAKQSILAGIGMSLVAMLAASLGFVTPIAGAALQEAIDVAVIINALRASR